MDSSGIFSAFFFFLCETAEPKAARRACTANLVAVVDKLMQRIQNSGLG
jgi:hypothetical protein